MRLLNSTPRNPVIENHDLQNFGLAVDRSEEVDGYSINFVTIRETHDLAPMLKGLPDDMCQCPHWGYVFKGRVTWRYADHEEVSEAGDAYYAPPGHALEAEAGTELLEISPAEELRETEAVIMANVQRMQNA